jgi:secretion/DNA translocation related TadE-like protein
LRSHADPCRGSASLLVATWVVVLGMLAAAAAVLSSVLAVRERAAAAADLGALAGASAALDGAETACARAADIVVRNGARLVDCDLRGASVRVVVESPPPSAVALLAHGRIAGIRARAHAELTAARVP